MIAMVRKILITGYGGQLGTELFELAAKEFETLATCKSGIASDKIKIMDITNRKSVVNVIKNFKPHLVIHTAALTKVDLCEKDKKLAYDINVLGTKNIVDACKTTKSKIIYISTDFVFDGDVGFYTENDKPNPINYYGETKLMGEKTVVESGLDYIIARTSVIYSHSRKTFNFVTWVIDELRKGNSIKVAEDHYNSPTLASNLAEALLELYKKNSTGLYNVSGDERISRYKFAKKIAKVMVLNKNMIKPVKMEDLCLLAKRPKDSSLNNSKVKKTINIKLLNINEGLSRIKNML